MAISRYKALTLLRKNLILDEERSLSERSILLEERSTLSRLRAEERKNIIKMRSQWSSWILFCIVLIVVFDAALILMLGGHILSFESPWFTPSFILDSLAKVFGLAFVVVKFLFGKGSCDTGKDGE